MTQPSRSVVYCDTLHYVLFLDVGSRGNSGLGGSGSAIVFIGSDGLYPRIQWMACVSYAAKTTTNDYENTEVSLSDYARHLRGLYVVEDSKIILQHMIRRSLPKSSRLRDVYEQRRTIAESFISCTGHTSYDTSIKWMTSCRLSLWIQGIEYRSSRRTPHN